MNFSTTPFHNHAKSRHQAKYNKSKGLRGVEPVLSPLKAGVTHAS